MSYGRTIRVCQGGVCARCDRQELHNLTTFTKSVDYYWRDMVVAAECLRCAQQRCCLAEGVDRLFKRNEVEVVRVCLPANVVSDARRVRNLSQGALLWGTTAANCELQMAQILNGRRSIEGLTDAESDAVVYLGGPIMRDEEVNGQVRRRCCAGGEVRGTTWTRRAKGEEYGHTGRNADYVPPAPRRGVLRGVRDFGVAAGRMIGELSLEDIGGGAYHPYHDGLGGEFVMAMGTPSETGGQAGQTGTSAPPAPGATPAVATSPAASVAAPVVNPAVADASATGTTQVAAPAVADASATVAATPAAGAAPSNPSAGIPPPPGLSIESDQSKPPKAAKSNARLEVVPVWGRMSDTHRGNDLTTVADRETNARHASERHLHTCVKCGTHYAHQHSGGLKPHDQRMGQCPSEACARHGPGAAATWAAFAEHPLAEIINANPSVVQDVVDAAEQYQQQLALVDGRNLLSQVVDFVPAEVSGTSFDTGDGVLDESIGQRVAVPRFPKLTHKRDYIFNNSPVNLIMAEQMRDIGVGLPALSTSEKQCLLNFTQAICDHLWSDEMIDKTLKSFESIKANAVPRKWSPGPRPDKELDQFLAQAQLTAVPWSKVVKAFVKSEVTAKQKPRPIADHGVDRLLALCMVAFVFDHAIGHLRYACIKNRDKRLALTEIFGNIASLKARDIDAFALENDLTAFEFGICEELKEAESKVLRHIAKRVAGQLLETGETAFERVVEPRSSACVWTMSYKDAAQQKCRLRVYLPRAMRESGDRLTSTGNWFQNCAAWSVQLCTPETVAETIARFVKTRGRDFFYTSTLDGAKYMAKLAWEGDDTAGGLEEKARTKDAMQGFFKKYGWSAKLKVLGKGDEFLEFVGYRALFHDGRPVFDGMLEATPGETRVSGLQRIVMMPDAKRMLTTKHWTTSTIPKDKLKGTYKLYAAKMGDEFADIAPMYAFAKALYLDNKSGTKVDEGAARDMAFSAGSEMFRTVSDASKTEFPEPRAGDQLKWRRLMTVAAGKFTEVEWAAMCGLTTLQAAGQDVATHVPQSWIA